MHKGQGGACLGVQRSTGHMPLSTSSFRHTFCCLNKTHSSLALVSLYRWSVSCTSLVAAEGWQSPPSDGGVWGVLVCFTLESFIWRPAAGAPPERKGMSNLNTNGRKQDSFPPHGELESLHQKGCLQTWYSFRTIFGANAS